MLRILLLIVSVLSIVFPIIQVINALINNVLFIPLPLIILLCAGVIGLNLAASLDK